MSPRNAEEKLIALAQKGDHGAFMQLIESYDQKVINLTFRFTGNKFDRNDLYQEIFLACFTALPKFTGKSSFYTWLYRISLNKCLDFQHSTPLDSTSIDAIAPDISWEKRSMLESIQTASNRLTGQQKICFHLFHLEEWTIEEIAKVIDCSIGTVKSHLDRARNKIRQDAEVLKWTR